MIRRAAVLGAGTMGAQIAALLAGHGIPCDLFDLPSEGQRNRLAEEAKRRLATIKPPPLLSPESLNLIRPANFSDDLSRLEEADWVIEAVTENLDTKRELWAQAAPFLRADVIISSNTSAIPVASIADALPKKLRRRFLGTHFFNPPRYLRLLEVIRTPDTDPKVAAAIQRFAEQVLGKGVVYAHDIPNFIANRIGAYGLMITLRAMEEFGLGPDEVDSITGPAIGRPSSATFRTLDLVGPDVQTYVCENMRQSVTEAWEQEAFKVPSYLRELVKRGWIGEKAGQGFYKREVKDGETQILALQLDTFEYRPRRRVQAASLAAVQDVEDPGERLRTLVAAEDTAGRFAWRVLSQVLAYSAQKVEEIADDIASIDRAMRLGFGWEIGPFEIWDALGVSATVERMQADGVAVPTWVEKMAAEGAPFYRQETKASFQVLPQGRTYSEVPAGDRTISLQGLRAVGSPVIQRPGATLLDIGDGVAFLDFHSPKQAIGLDMMDMLEEAAELVPQDFRGLVIGSHVQPNFCVGANLLMILLAAQEEEWEEIDATVRQFQGAMLRLKRSPFPVVTAPYGRTLGGGAELALSVDRVVAATESYIGLVETGMGLIPAGGGVKEMLVRVLEGLPGGLAGLVTSSRGGPPPMTPEVDPAAAVSRLFETISLAKVSESALEARSLGYLRSSDATVSNLDHLLYVAKEAVVTLDAQGYTPPLPASLPVLGGGTRALLELVAHHMVWAGYATEHDLKVAKKLAYVLTGGDRPQGSVADEEYFLDLEREAFLSLSGEPKTQARMQHMLQRGTPPRN